MTQRLPYWIGRFVVAIIQALPLRWVARLGRATGGLVYWLDAGHRRVAAKNIQLSFPEKSAREVRQIVREHFRRLGENYVSAVKTISMPIEEVLAACEIVGIEKLKPPMHLRATPGNRIVAIGHFGNFELYALIARCVPGLEPATTYRALRQPGLNRLLEELRDRTGCHFFERKSGLKKMMQMLRRKHILLGLLCDQHAGMRGVWGDFLGRDCSTSPAPAVLALRYNAPLNTAICFRVGSGRWRIEIGDEIPLRENGVERSVDAIMGDVNRILEEAIRRDPANWFWVHRRWRARPTGRFAPQPN